MDFVRQLDILDPEKITDLVTIIGAGGIGSPTALLLVKMGFRKIKIFDDDTIENHNLPNQIFRNMDIGKKKVQAIKEICEEFSKCEVNIIADKFTNQKLLGLVVSGVDSMEERKQIWPNIKMNPFVKLYIDGRMGGEIGIIKVINPVNTFDVQNYEKSLHSDEEAVEVPCTARSILYNTFSMASLIGGLFSLVSK